MDSSIALIAAFVLGLAIQPIEDGSAGPALFGGLLVDARQPHGIRDLVTADVDQDGHQDVITASELGLLTSVSVLLGDGRGGLRWTATRETPALNGGMVGRTDSVVLDCDGDGRLDVVTSGRYSTLLVFPGDGAGGLHPPYRLPVRGMPIELRTADMDRDGLLDLVTRVDRDVLVFLRRPSGGFAPATVHNIGPFGPVMELEVGDVDGDRAPDVLSVVGYTVRLLLNSGHGTLLPAEKVPGTWLTARIALGDFDGDGLLDLARSWWPETGRGNISFHRGDGQGGFPFQARAPLDQYGYDNVLTLSDLDTGGGREVVVVLRGGLHTAQPRAGEVLVRGPFHPPGSTRFVLADLDEDGHQDLIQQRDSLLGPHGVCVQLGAGDGTLKHVRVSAKGFEVPGDSLSLHDLDGDGALDLLGCGWELVQMAQGTGDGRFNPPLALRARHWVTQVLPGDFDGDGIVDLMLVGRWPWAVSLALGEGPFAFGEARILPLPTIAPPTLDSLPALSADLDADGRTEIALDAPRRAATAIVGAGAGGMPIVEGWVPTPLSVGPHSVRDLDGDGRIDLCYLRHDALAGCSLWRFEHQASGGYSTPQPFLDLPLPWVPGIFPLQAGEPSGPRPAWLQLADLDGNGRLDVVARRKVRFPPPFYFMSQSELALWHRLPSGGWNAGFEQRLSVELTGGGPIDLDGDGLLELTFGLGEYPATLGVWRIERGLPGTQPQIYALYPSTLGDVDGDGCADVVGTLGSYWDGYVYTYLNRSGASR